MDPTASAGPDQPPYFSDPAHLLGLLQQLVADLDYPTITYLLGDTTTTVRTTRATDIFPPSLRCGKTR